MTFQLNNIIDLTRDDDDADILPVPRLPTRQPPRQAPLDRLNEQSSLQQRSRFTGGQSQAQSQSPISQQLSGSNNNNTRYGSATTHGDPFLAAAKLASPGGWPIAEMLSPSGALPDMRGGKSTSTTTTPSLGLGLGLGFHQHLRTSMQTLRQDARLNWRAQQLSPTQAAAAAAAAVAGTTGGGRSSNAYQPSFYSQPSPHQTPPSAYYPSSINSSFAAANRPSPASESYHSRLAMYGNQGPSADQTLPPLASPRFHQHSSNFSANGHSSRNLDHLPPHNPHHSPPRLRLATAHSTLRSPLDSSRHQTPLPLSAQLSAQLPAQLSAQLPAQLPAPLSVQLPAQSSASARFSPPPMGPAVSTMNQTSAAAQPGFLLRSRSPSFSLSSGLPSSPATPACPAPVQTPPLSMAAAAASAPTASAHRSPHSPRSPRSPRSPLSEKNSLQTDSDLSEPNLRANPPQATTPKRIDWTMDKMEAALQTCIKDLHADHSRLVEYCIESQEPRPRQHVSDADDFADMPSLNDEAEPAQDQGDRLKIRLKVHRENQRRAEGRVMLVETVSLKTPHDKVPKYRFHHVEIAKNILSPNTPLKFIPHFRDLEDGSEDKKKFDQWIEELESMEVKSGFDSSKRFDKWASTRTTEYAKLVSLYLDSWMRNLGLLEGNSCSKTTLIRYMAASMTTTPTTTAQFTPQQKTSLLSSCSGPGAALTPRATETARLFTETFNRVFAPKHVTLSDVLRQDEAFESMVDPRKANKEAAIAAAQAAQAEAAAQAAASSSSSEKNIEQIQQYLGTYTMLGCMICHAHSCEHGEFDAENIRRCFSIEDCGGKLWMHVEQRREMQARERQKAAEDGASHDGSSRASAPCDNQCYRSYDVGDPAFANRPWTEDETNLLRSLHYTLGDSDVKLQCTASALLDRRCWEVYRRMKELGMGVDEAAAETETETVPAPVVPPKPANWYDRHRKTLNGDWSDHTYTHIHALREQREPCNHEGPCTAARGCPCADAKLLCERFCRCTAESCAYKFTGCACHGSGKTCYARQKEGRPCICVQLNRECDPVLCGGCGARERADPRNRDDEALHATGCQNVALQRGKAKAVLLGQSQLDGCGYGLFTAEDMAADAFVLEYIGELITHDEGVRREARRGDVFNQESNASYLFTLLEQDGIWVDAAIYGNLSRYINHASEHDKRGCNITPKILYVNGEFRIRFTAMRDIKAGEELFFNYGENFPNLTKKLLEDKASGVDDGDGDGDSSVLSSRGGPGSGSASRSRGGAGATTAKKGAGRKAAKAVQSSNNSSVKRAKAKGARKEAPPVNDGMDDDGDKMELDFDLDEDQASVRSGPGSGRWPRRGGGPRADSDDEFTDSPRRSRRTRRSGVASPSKRRHERQSRDMREEPEAEPTGPAEPAEPVQPAQHDLRQSTTHRPRPSGGKHDGEPQRKRSRTGADSSQDSQGGEAHEHGEHGEHGSVLPAHLFYGQRHRSMSRTAVVPDSNDDDDNDENADDGDDDTADRSQRRRQKPVRYRGEH